MEEFKCVLRDCMLTDLRFKGSKYTYSNKRKGENETKVRLGRAIATQQWREKFPNCKVSHLTTYVSDHCPLLVDLDADASRGKSKIFRFEPMWFRHEKLKEFVDNCWSMELSTMSNVSDKLKELSKRLYKWNANTFGNVQHNIRRLKKDLDTIRECPRTEEVVAHEVKVVEVMDEWLLREEILWKQRSRADWLKEEDSNTRFFYAKASSRRRRNRDGPRNWDRG
ncbi:hypothetical protein QQ045_028214 [Rhodiola kirilowii]